MATGIDLGFDVIVPPRPKSTVRPWERTYVSAVLAADFFSAALVCAVALLLFASTATTPWWAVEVAAPTAWIAAVAVAGGYDRRYLGSGVQEFRRLALGLGGLLATVATVAWLTDVSLARPMVLVGLPAAATLSGLARYAVRKHIHRLRRDGRFRYRTLVVGHVQGVDELAPRLRRNYQHGFDVVGASLPEPSSTSVDHGRVPVVGTFSTVVEDVRRLDIDTVAVISCPEMNGERLRRLAWELEPTGAELVVAPALVEVAGPRMSIRPVEGLPLLHVDQPAFTGFRRVLKRGVDVVVSATTLLVLAPVVLAIAVAVKLDSPGPVLFRQTRIGYHGELFTIQKFRTMVVDAERLLEDLRHLNEGAGPLFKLRRDPRITRIGRFLRRTSLDELPQLVNVLLGHMSLVGPRPHLPAEVAAFGEDPSRRLLVKPGLTGLWQVSGRSRLSWEESVQLDLRYIENWSLAFDAYIMWKTLRAVIDRSGAY